MEIRQNVVTKRYAVKFKRSLPGKHTNISMSSTGFKTVIPLSENGDIECVFFMEAESETALKLRIKKDFPAEEGWELVEIWAEQEQEDEHERS